MTDEDILKGLIRQCNFCLWQKKSVDYSKVVYDGEKISDCENCSTQKQIEELQEKLLGDKIKALKDEIL